MATRAANKRVALSYPILPSLNKQLTNSCKLTREYQTIQQNPPPYIIAHPSETNILEFVPLSLPRSPLQFIIIKLLIQMELHPYRPSQNTLRKWLILGNPPFSSQLPLRPACHPHAHSFRPLSTVNPPLPLNIWLSPEILQPSLGSLHHPHWAHVFYDQWRNDDRLRACHWHRKKMGGSEDALVGQHRGGSFQKLAAGVNPSAKGVGAVKAGDVGVKFKAEWPELDTENWAWMKTNRVDPTTGSLLPDPDPTSSSLTSCSSEVAALHRGPGGSGLGFGTVVGGGHVAT